ncbi:hypothetical protein [Paenibacillus azoreducens]|uniref:DUF1453 family protein n=1 Tax=Paenibacillus azoreducens TaxID=116718 RepID=A0A920CSY6_9BACL|nr:hypothetical protein [Paenibacillus azoreducens]GIO48654.1 hypothetical protein J34TS1_34190 [Paenibacillus azoreducens]
MPKIAIIVLGIVIILIIRQLIPKKIDSFDLLGMPIMALIRTWIGLPDGFDTVVALEFICLLALGTAVGYFQARKTRVFRRERDNQLCSVGGYAYIVGWVVMLLGRVIILFGFHFAGLTAAFHEGNEQFINEIIRILSQAGDWLVWSAILASSIIYTATLYKKYPDIKGFVHQRIKQIIHDTNRRGDWR